MNRVIVYWSKTMIEGIVELQECLFIVLNKYVTSIGDRLYSEFKFRLKLFISDSMFISFHHYSVSQD